MIETVNTFNQRKPLTKRQKEIIQIMVEMNSEAITVKAVAEQLGVSNRTILRDIPDIETWMEDNDFHFDHRPGVGLLIDETDENRSLILELLHIENQIPHYSRSERRQIILGTLFYTDEPIKAYVFTSQLKVSQSTLFADLDALDLWLSDYNVSIIRRKGLGLYIEGDEYNLRQAVSNYIFEFCDIDQIPILLMDEKKKQEFTKVRNHPLLRFFEPEIIDCVVRIVTKAEDSLHVRYTDGGRVRLYMRYALAVYRMRNHHFIQSSPMERNRLSAMVELSATVQMVTEIEKSFDIKVPQYEIDYFAMHLSATRIWSDMSNFKDPTQAMDLWQVVMSMTRIVEQMTGLPFRNNSKFIDDLVNHIRVVEKRVNLDILVENQQTEEIREKNPALFDAVETACQVLREWMSPKELRTADIGYIALHFAAESIRIQEQIQKVNVAVVCPAGVGSSKILAANIRKNFKNVNVVKTLSAFNVDPEKLRKDGMDLIISTMPLQIDFPNIYVSSIMLQAGDKVRIENEIERLYQQRLISNMAQRTTISSINDLEDIRRITQIGNEIIEITENFQIIDLEAIEDKEALTKQAGALFATSMKQAEQITEGFLLREIVGDTYIKELQVYLFHCITDAIDHARFGYIKINQPFASAKGPVEGAVVMVVPKNEYALEPIGRLSALLVEEQDFLQALKRKDLGIGKDLTSQALVKYYRNEVSK